MMNDLSVVVPITVLYYVTWKHCDLFCIFFITDLCVCS